MKCRAPRLAPLSADTNVLYVTPDLGESDILRREFSALHPDLRLESTATPREAIERLEAGTSHYDAVLIELTKMNGEGLSLVRHIRKNNLPVGVVAIAVARDDAPSQEVLESGADHVVVKGKEFLPRLPTVLARAVERRTLEARLRAMLETAPVCLMRVAGDGTILAMNIAVLDMVEAERAEQIVDESWYERVVPDDQAACRDFIERASHGERGSFECQIKRLSGTHRTVLMGAVRAPVDADGTPSALVAMRDLDKTRSLEAGLTQGREKLGALETALSELAAQNQQLVAGHEAERAEWQPQQSSTDLTAERAAWEHAEATGRQEFVNKHRAERVATEHALKAAEARCQQLSADHESERDKWQEQLAAGKAQEAALKRQLLAISRTQQGTTRTIDLNAAIGQLSSVLSRLVGEDIEFGVEPASQLDLVEINPDHVEQLLLRLAVVVGEAMAAGGVVRLGTSSLQIDDAHVHEYPGVPPGRYARLTLKASGWGMDPQMQDRVASAVASGEESEAAKELGLASALRAFRQAGGHIAVKAEPGRELTFEGYLPTGG
jgi:PAS domain S-box-containing protein